MTRLSIAALVVALIAVGYWLAQDQPRKAAGVPNDTAAELERVDELITEAVTEIEHFKTDHGAPDTWDAHERREFDSLSAYLLQLRGMRGELTE